MNPFRSLPAMLAIGLAAACRSTGPDANILGYTLVMRTDSGATAVAGSPIAVAFTVTENDNDGTSRPAAGKTVTVAVTAGGGTVNGTVSATLTTAVDGTASVTWVLGPTVGVQTLRGSLSATLYLDLNVTAAPLPTMLVTNATCSVGGCRTLEIRAFIWMFRIPQNPLGGVVVGEVPPGSRCLVFPPSWTLRVIGPTDTVYTTWTPTNADGISLIAVDSALFHGPLNQAQADSMNHGTFPFSGGPAVGTSYGFVPGTAPGWSVTFPSATAFNQTVGSAASCNP